METPEGSDDGTGHLFPVLTAGTPEAYAAFAGRYYDREIDAAAVRRVWAEHGPTEATPAC